MMYAGLIEFLNKIFKSGKSAQIEYMSGRVITEKIKTINHDCVVLAGKREVCILYHAICRVEGVTDEESKI